MKLRSLALAGYKAYAGRSPSAPERPLQRVELAPLTLLIGKNNAGKSCLAGAIHHALAVLADTSNELPFPLGRWQRVYSSDFRALQHAHQFFMPIDFEFGIASQTGAELTLGFQVARSDADATEPSVTSRWFDGVEVADADAFGVLPRTAQGDTLGHEAAVLFDASAALGPIRPGIQPIYKRRQKFAGELPTTNSSAAQHLLDDEALRASVSQWMESALDGWRVDTSITLDAFELHGPRQKNLAAAGQGLQQVLPIVTLCRFRQLGRGGPDFLDIIEQPELHLHDAAHAPLGDLLLEAVEGRGTMVVETHSEALVLRVRRRIAEGRVPPDRVALYYIEDVGDGATIQRIHIRDDGEVDWWPTGVFSETFVEVMAIRRAQHGRGK